MEFPILPQSSQSPPPMFVNHTQRIINELQRRRLGNAFEALLDLGDEMHHAADQHPVVVDLDQMDRLFSLILQHSSYGIYERTDEIINTLLLLAIQRCEELLRAERRMSPGCMGWLSPTHSQTNQHLEVYRDFFTCIANHHPPRPTDDPALEAASHLLQKLCPRINGLSRWADREAKRAEQQERRSARITRQSGRQLEPFPRPQKPQAAGRPRPPMPTPPTQTGDIQPETVPTIPRRDLSRSQTALLTPDTCPFSETMRESRIVGGWGDAVAVSLDHTPVSFGDETSLNGKDVASSIFHPDLVEAGPIVDAGFRLRPQHAWSPRCCSFQGSKTRL